MCYNSSFSENSIATAHKKEQGLVGILHTTFAMLEGRTLRLLSREPLQCPNFNKVLLSRHSLQA
jgi:hypothetical protein